MFLQNNAAKTHRVVLVLKPQRGRPLGPCHPLVASDQLCPAELAANISFPFPYLGAALTRAAVQCQAWRHHSCPRLGYPSINEALVGTLPGRDSLLLPCT